LLNTAVDFSVAFTNQSVLAFSDPTIISGDFFFTSNAATTVNFPVLSAVVGDFVVSYNFYLVSFQAAALKTIGGVVSIAGNNYELVMAFSPMSQVNCDGGSGPESADLQGCARLRASRAITSSSVTFLTASLLTYAGGYLEIRTNAVLATIRLPQLSTVVGFLTIHSNPSLTFIHLPKLTFIGDRLFFCDNNAAFLIPSGPPDAPVGGFAVTGFWKGTKNCFFQQGNATCTYMNCP
jgi:hypothetical protein